ncbi:hypothetical protein CR513_02722, partial [Mucuna pruriens]
MVGHILNAFTAWTKIHVKIVSTIAFIIKKSYYIYNSNLVTKVCENPIQLELDDEITCRNSTVPLYLCQKDILEICNGDEMLYISIIQL